MLWVRHLLILGKFEDQPVARERVRPRGLEGQLDTGGGRIDRIGQEIDRQARRGGKDSSPSRGFDRLHAALLIEAIAIGIAYLAKDAGGRFARRAAHQRFIGKHTVLLDIDDRLERHRDGQVECRAVAASLATDCYGGLGWNTYGHRATVMPYPLRFNDLVPRETTDQPPSRPATVPVAIGSPRRVAAVRSAPSIARSTLPPASFARSPSLHPRRASSASNAG